MNNEMSFFASETISSRVEAQQTIDNRNDNNALLQREFTIGGQSGFQKSPYELFRENVAKYCDRYMTDTFEFRDCMSTAEKASIAYRNNCCRNSPGRVGNSDESTLNHVNQNLSRVLEEINDVSSRNQSSTNNDTNPFSVLSVSFQPSDKNEPNKKMSILERISKLMNTYNSNNMSFTQHAQLKQQQSPHRWSGCECHVHIGKHSNCCQCQEPYHRTSCDCVQHSGSHSYCCRCDIHLLQQYDQYLKKKKYLRLNPGEDVAATNSIPFLNNINPSRPSTSNTDKISMCEDRGLFPPEFLNDTKMYPRSRIGEFPQENNDFQSSNSERSYSWRKECDVAQSENGDDHPCESCSKKLDDVYGSALREVHSMLVEVSRSLLAPSMNCCTLDALIKDTLLRQKLLQNSSICSQDLTKSSLIHEPPVSERQSYPLEESNTFPRILNRQSDAAIQVNTYFQEPIQTPREKCSNKNTRRKTSKKDRIKGMCVLS